MRRFPEDIAFNFFVCGSRCKGNRGQRMAVLHGANSLRFVSSAEYDISLFATHTPDELEIVGLSFPPSGGIWGGAY